MISEAATQETSRFHLLLRTVQANALFSALSGLGFILAPGWLSKLSGIQPAVAFTVIGLGLLGYAIWLWLAAREVSIPRHVTLAAIGADSAWVIASIIIVASDYLPLTVAGKWGLVLVADVVAVFAVLQLVGLRRLRN